MVRSIAPQGGNSITEKKGPNYRFLAMVGAVVMVLFLIFAGATYILVRSMTDIRAEIGSISLMIDEDTCNVSVELDYSPDIDIEPEELIIVLDDSTVPLGYDDKMVWGTVNEEQFSQIVEDEKVRMKGTLSTRNGLGISSEREINRDVDLSFLGEILSGVLIKDVKLSTRFPFTTVVDFNLTVDMDRDVTIVVNNTRVQLSNGIAQEDIDLVQMQINNMGIGSGRVEMPTSVLITMGLWGRNVTLSGWGLQVEFEFPFSIQ